MTNPILCGLCSPPCTVTMSYFNSCNGSQNEWRREAWSRLHAEVWWGNTIEKVYENYDGWWWGGNILNDLWQINSEDIQRWMKLGLNFIPWLVECCGSDTTLVFPQRPRHYVTQMMLTSRLPTISLLFVLASSALLAFMNQHKTPVTNRVQRTDDLLK